MNKQTTKANVPPPPRQTKQRLMAAVPLPEKAPENLSKPTDAGTAGFVDLNFKVDETFHRRFKLEATVRGLSMKDLLIASFRSYLEQHGGTMEVPRTDLFQM